MSRFYVTTPIYYVNDVPHLGTAYTTIVADALRRYHLLRGDETRMLTGTDEHGLKIERAAQERGMTPSGVRRRDERALPGGVAEARGRAGRLHPHDRAAPRARSSQELWRRSRAQPDDIYLGAYEGWYCVGCEEFKTEKELARRATSARSTRKPVERVKEETYFFRLSKYAEPLLDLYEEHPEFIQPETPPQRGHELRRRAGSRTCRVSRTSFTWGIPVPGDPKHVMYVWFDALANYWTALAGHGRARRRFWSGETRVVHLVGKDILRFHAVYWPAFLLERRAMTSCRSHGATRTGFSPSTGRRWASRSATPSTRWDRAASARCAERARAPTCSATSCCAPSRSGRTATSISRR